MPTANALRITQLAAVYDLALTWRRLTGADAADRTNREEF